MEAQENYKTCRDPDGRLYLQYDFTTEDGDLFEAEPCDLTQARRMRDQWQEIREKHRCTRCGMARNDVEERYSFGVEAGKLCISCCAGYRDNCGLDQDQGNPQVLMLEGEQYWEEYEDTCAVEGGLA